MTKLSDVMLRDTRAAQPAATTVPAGTQYYVTDESVTEQSNGTIWEDVSDAGGGASGAAGGQLSGTYPNPSVTASHSGSTHAATQAAAEATAAGALASHEADATSVHGITNTANLVVNPMTTAADLIVGGASGAPARLAKGSDGQVLTVDPTTHLLVWATPAAGGSGTLTTVEEVDGSPTDSAVTKLVFPNGTLAIAAHVATYTPGAASGLSYTRPPLFPATPTYPFDSPTLDAAFAAHSNGGSFVIGNVISNGYDWGGSAVELQYSAQFGGIYLVHSNTDLDFEVHGLRAYGFAGNGTAAFMIGIGGLNSSGDGICSLAYNDGTAYIASVAAYNYTGNTDSWAGHGAPNIGGSAIFSDICLRIKRISGTWTAYASHSGRVWDKTYSTRADAVTVDRLYLGLLYNTALTYSGRLTADSVHVTT